MSTVDRAKIIKNLEQGAERLSCAGFIQHLSTLERDTLFTEACFDRIHRKSQFIDRIFQETQDWNETFYRMLFRAIDISFNRGAYEELAKKFWNLNSPKLLQFFLQKIQKKTLNHVFQIIYPK